MKPRCARLLRILQFVVEELSHFCFFPLLGVYELSYSLPNSLVRVNREGRGKSFWHGKLAPCGEGSDACSAHFLGTKLVVAKITEN